MNRVSVVGSINQDIVAGAERHPRPGETVRGTTLRIHPGGKGANQAVAAARAGAAASLIGCVGDDVAGKELLVCFRDAGVDCGAVSVVTDAPTGTGLITVAGGENTIVVIAGANDLLTPAMVARFDCEAGDVCVAQLETPVETTVAVFQRARAAGATTILNPAPAGEVPDELLALSDILVVNEFEFASTFRVPIDEWLAGSALAAVSDRFSGPVLVTLGARGVSIWDGGSRTSIPGHQVEAVDSTGAGDCFVGYFAAGLVSGCTLEQAARRANRAAAISVTRHGAAESMPLASEVGE
jgi:ribokinase